jgi:DNA-3-methyladenine glycosylase
MNPLDFLNNSPIKVAPRLLGCILIRIDGQKRLSGMIVETEAYDQTDVASHSYRGETPRTKVMFGASGIAYVYFTYGMHYCLNIVTGPIGHGAAVLIRAIEPIEGKKYMYENRDIKLEYQLTNGPAKLCQALKIDKKLNGHDLLDKPLQLIIKPPISKNNIVRSNRIGISQGKDPPWRFYLKDNPYVSRH